MKYIIDIDAFKDCLDLVEAIKVNGHEYVAVHNVKLLIDRFPKEAYDLPADFLVSEGVGTKVSEE